MALTLGMKISGCDFNYPSSLSANKTICNLFIHQVPRAPLKYGFAAWEKIILTFWRRNYFFFNFSTPCIQNVNNTGTKQVRIMKQTAF